MSFYDCIFSPSDSLVPWRTSLGQTDVLTRSLLFCEQDPRAARENAEMEHGGAGGGLQSGGSEVGRDVRQIRRRQAASAPEGA